MRCIKAAFPTIPPEYSGGIRNPFFGSKSLSKELYFQDFQRVIAKSVNALEATEANLRKNWKQMVGNAAGGRSI